MQVLHTEKNMKKLTHFYIIRGKTVKHWSLELKLSVPRIYQLIKRNELEDRIDGIWKPKERKAGAIYKGKTISEWSKNLNYDNASIRKWIKMGIFDQILKTGKTPKDKVGRLIKGKNLATWAKILGITRERTRQLANLNKLEDRIEKYEQKI